MSISSAKEMVLRAYREDDESSVVEMLRASLGDGPAGERSPAFFRWKHFDNPFGPSYMLVAEMDDRIVGLRAFMRWRFVTGGRSVEAVRAVDTATHPDYQGMGIFRALTLRALEELKGKARFVFNTPNEASLPGYLKWGWQVVGEVPASVGVWRPLRLLSRLAIRGLSKAPDGKSFSAGEILRPGGDLERLLQRSEVIPGRLATPRTLDYLRWRYGSAPFLNYRAVAAGSDSTRGLAIFRVRSRGAAWEAAVTELLVEEGDVRTARRLLRRVGNEAKVDHISAHFPRGTTGARAAAHLGFLRIGSGKRFVVNPLSEVDPDPLDFESWSLTLGDLEVF